MVIFLYKKFGNLGSTRKGRGGELFDGKYVDKKREDGGVESTMNIFL